MPFLSFYRQQCPYSTTTMRCLWTVLLVLVVAFGASSHLNLDTCIENEHCDETLHVPGRAFPRSVTELWSKLDCDSVLSQNRPILIQSEWEDMRNVYLKVAGITDGTSISNERGLHPAIVADYAGEKGRGLFATAPIRKGEMIWESTRTRSFDDKETFYRFLEGINPDYVCDVLEWKYMAKRFVSNETDGEIQWNEEAEAYDFDPSIYVLCIDLDDGSLANTVDYESQDERDFNAYTVAHGGCSHTSFASRDIEEGEEILESYLDFSYPLNPNSL